MLLIDVNGVAIDARISRSRSSNIEREGMKIVHGIIVHQTGGATSQSALDAIKSHLQRVRTSL